MIKRILSVLLVFAMLFSLAACSSKPTESKEESRVFVDDAGREVEVPKEISRIVPSAAMAQIILMSLAPEKIVGLTSRLNDNSKGFVPECLSDLPYFGSLKSDGNMNVEELALAEPQLIIDIGEPKDSLKERIDALQEQTMIPTVYISFTLETAGDTFRKLGELLGEKERGEALAQFCEETYDRAVKIMEEVGDNKKDCLYILGEEGLNVIAANFYHSELLDMMTDNLAVMENPISKGSGNEVSMEQISLWNPEFIIFSSDSIYDTADELPVWEQLNAIANKNYVEVPEIPFNWMSMPPSVQRYLGLIWLPAVLYPEYCDYDVETEIKEFFELFYGVTISDEQFAAITNKSFIK